MSISYLSTRGEARELPFDEVVLAGLASDGGLYLPKELPQFSTAEIASFSTLSYPELAVRVMRPFTEGTISDEVLTKLVEESYASFRHAAVAPLSQLAHNRFLLELFHGPTLAFKDFALQFLGRLLDHLLAERGQSAVVVGATSGDTGSAAIAGCSGRDRLSIYILHPNGRVSEVQRRQMTTVPDANVHNIALEGTFDDCQDIVKALFADTAFNEKHRLVAVNSINWARVLAQVVYYFYAACALGSPARAVSFSVPTGNFGDIFAGYIAKQMGLPIDRLVVASNSNDILTRCIRDGDFSARTVVPTLSPSMDIQVSSNFERMLFELYGRDGAATREKLQAFRKEGSAALSDDVIAGLRRHFDAAAVSDDVTAATIREVYAQTGMLVDPHTAVGIRAANECIPGNDIPVITLATAHPAKFPDAVTKATGKHPELPAHLSDLFERKERFVTCANSADAVKALIEGSR